MVQILEVIDDIIETLLSNFLYSVPFIGGGGGK